MSDNDEDEPTVVIDFNSLKSELNSEEILTENPELLFKDELEVLEDGTRTLISEVEEEFRKNIYFFDYESQYFTTKFAQEKLEPNMQILTDLKALNNVLKNDPESIIVFYYNQHPKVTNQLSKQIKNKLPDTKTLIVAKNLSDEKAKTHQQSKYGADAYLSDPFDIIKFYSKIQELY